MWIDPVFKRFLPFRRQMNRNEMDRKEKYKTLQNGGGRDTNRAQPSSIFYVFPLLFDIVKYRHYWEKREQSKWPKAESKFDFVSFFFKSSSQLEICLLHFLPDLLKLFLHLSQRNITGFSSKWRLWRFCFVLGPKGQPYHSLANLSPSERIKIIEKKGKHLQNKIQWHF